MNDDTDAPTSFCVVLTTLGSEAQAETLATQIVAAGLGACVQVQAVKSFYRWEGKACVEPEWSLSIKTRKALYERLEDFIRAHHAYQTPEIVQVPIEAGSADYLRWVAAGSAG
jgi:periplasmic divalent cation tolerance protein